MSYGNILIVEDEAKIASIVHDYVKPLFTQVDIISDGKKCLEKLADTSYEPDLIILDLMLPGVDGMTICHTLRKEGKQFPIIMLTAKIEELDKLMGFDVGADDYICKPFSPRELVARIHAVLRRTFPRDSDEPNEILFSGIHMNLASHEVTVDGKAVRLTPNEFGILKVLLRNPNRVYSRLDLLGNVLGYDYIGYDRTIDTHIKNLRKKITVASNGREIIQTIYGVGYKAVDE